MQVYVEVTCQHSNLVPNTLCLVVMMFFLSLNRVIMTFAKLELLQRLMIINLKQIIPKLFSFPGSLKSTAYDLCFFLKIELIVFFQHDTQDNPLLPDTTAPTLAGLATTTSLTAQSLWPAADTLPVVPFAAAITPITAWLIWIGAGRRGRGDHTWLRNKEINLGDLFFEYLI